MKKIINKFYPYFLPHPQTHKKPVLLSWQFLLIYISLFLLLRSIFGVVELVQPGILGVNSNITIQQIIEGTNRERQAKGLPPLVENSSLSAAAAAKAQNMFDENYWAHFSPSGKDPWGFISRAGYRFAYAGENLARNYQNSDEVVAAWMASASHRDNILDSRYQDIGIAVVDGTMDGQKTTLVVQMFGRPVKSAVKAEAPAAIAQAVPTPVEVNLAGQKTDVQPPVPNQVLPSVSVNRPVLIAGAQVPVKPALVNPLQIIRVFGISLAVGLALLLFFDYLVLMRRRVYRISSHHLAHMGILALSAASLMSVHTGEIL